MKKNILLVIFIFLISFHYEKAHSAVWKEERSWNQAFQADFSRWIHSKDVHTHIFHNKNSPYYGLKPDCADLIYALRVIYAYENKLPFLIRDPLSWKPSKYLSNNSRNSLWDRNEGSPQAVKAFLNYLFEYAGTESLANLDSYPISIKNIRPGDVFMWKVEKDGAFTRHSYVIKKINDYGYFDLLYSTQERKKSGRPLGLKTGAEISKNIQLKNWGFKRVKFPRDYARNTSSLENYSLEQYTLARTYSGAHYTRELHRRLANRIEPLNAKLLRQWNNVCSEVVDRIHVVSSAIKLQKKVGGRCFNEREYDEYSTPQRDERIKKTYLALMSTWQSTHVNNHLSKISPETQSLIHSTLNSRISRNEELILENKCPLKLFQDQKMNLSKFREALFQGEISSHPNDNAYRRWGIHTGKKTTCKKYY